MVAGADGGADAEVVGGEEGAGAAVVVDHEGGDPGRAGVDGEEVILTHGSLGYYRYPLCHRAASANS